MGRGIRKLLATISEQYERIPMQCPRCDYRFTLVTQRKGLRERCPYCDHKADIEEFVRKGEGE